MMNLGKYISLHRTYCYIEVIQPLIDECKRRDIQTDAFCAGLYYYIIYINGTKF